MATERVRMWRPADEDRVLLMAGRTTHYAIETALETPTTRLERDERLTGWLRALIDRSPAGRLQRSPLVPRDDKALRLARGYPGRWLPGR
jgi:hypothetical protein